MLDGRAVFEAFAHKGICITNLPALDSAPYQSSLKSFLSEPDAYRLCFLQQRYRRGFDGYSYLRQTDSTNQYPEDLLHTFVLSKFSPASHFPAAFERLLKDQWDSVVQQVMALERALCKHLGEPFVAFYDQHIGHMLSANYYPPVAQFKTTARENTRLSAHPDASFVTVFPFGIPKGFSYQMPSGDWAALDTFDRIVLFPGHLLQLCSGGLLRALQHKVSLPDSADTDRYSFAFFSLPCPGHRFHYAKGDSTEYVTTEDYLNAYLSLFQDVSHGNKLT